MLGGDQQGVRASNDLFIARFSSRDERVAAATLTFGDDVPTRWEHALCPGDDPANLNDGEFFGYGVDSGTGGLMDAVAAELLAKRLCDDDDLGNPCHHLDRGSYGDSDGVRLVSTLRL